MFISFTCVIHRTKKEENLSLEKYFLCIKKTCLTWFTPVCAVWAGYYGLLHDIKMVEYLAITLTIMVIAVAILFIYERTKLEPF